MVVTLTMNKKILVALRKEKR